MNIAQCVFPRLNIDQYNADNAYNALIKKLVAASVGGFCIFEGNSENVPKTLAELQFLANIPLLFCADLEHGLPMRLHEGGTAFPHHMALAKATEKNNTAKYTATAANCIAKEAKNMGIRWNLAPVCDINSNPLNPVINIRAFGQNKQNVASNATEYINGTQAEHVAACAKHFPGHGNTTTDSHIQIPTINKSWQELNTNEMIPFHAACQANVAAIMVGHINVGQNNIANMWKNNIAEARRQGQNVGWNGIITTDALDMQAIVEAERAGAFHKHNPMRNNPAPSDINYAGEAAACAFDAGADIILMPPEPMAVIKLLNAKLMQTNAKEQICRIEDSLRRIRKLKQFVELLPQGRPKESPQPQLFAEHMQLALKIAIAATDILPPEGNSLLPIPEETPFAAFSILQRAEDMQAASRFFTMLGQATENNCDYAFLDENITETQLQDMAISVNEAQFVVFALFYKGRGYSKALANAAQLNNIISTIARQRQTIIICFGDPYIAQHLNGTTKILTYSDSFASLAAAVATLAGRTID